MSAFVFAGGRCSKTSKACACCFRRNVAVVFAHGMRYALSIELYTVVALCVVTTNLVG